MRFKAFPYLPVAVLRYSFSHFGQISFGLICRLFHIKGSVAIGVAIGTAAHALGTTRAIEIGETEGAMSGLAIGVAGLITVFLVPLLLYLFNNLL
jgi:putative effector of murein hydrolase